MFLFYLSFAIEKWNGEKEIESTKNIEFFFYILSCILCGISKIASVSARCDCILSSHKYECVPFFLLIPSFFVVATVVPVRFAYTFSIYKLVCMCKMNKLRYSIKMNGCQKKTFGCQKPKKFKLHHSKWDERHKHLMVKIEDTKWQKLSAFEEKNICSTFELTEWYTRILAAFFHVILQAMQI